jgi:hypothetical protein
MKKTYVNKCVCEKCLGLSKIVNKESVLFAFVGNCPANIQCDLGEFENSLEFSSVVHWDVGFTGNARYYIYRNSESNFFAWYDRASKTGFKLACKNSVCNDVLMEAA